MIELYTFTTPNGRKPAIMLEEVGLPYQIKMINISKGEQFSPEFIAINPNSKIPAIVDRETNITVFESGAILIYLAEKTGQFLPSDTQARFRVIEWLMFQMGGVGPMFGQLSHFRKAAPTQIDYAINRYHNETLRLLGVLDRQLENNEFIAGSYSIADMATYPWVAALSYLEIAPTDYSQVQRWVQTMEERPAVQRGMALAQE
ncbi:glutathione S-transferase N-terminal domain-containing protein [Gloeocapsa sp. PCC 73106]|uniref:glutathione S-transferase N-terminal domain-containing protein n=1 Tax=Gloeocapsa sp. PCC 73106 TaxID=102232 RepID=UPI0002AD10D3|nr:glutathione S-transferase N-terminal domain-containing protein [Gloeocapsa sp. PCC 73106]ELR98676.1 glutathione S-transferase [Gloeocapsa sp. PCC 73106]